VTRHFVYFLTCSFRNSALRQLRRLRNPRYAIAALVGFAYFAFLFSGGFTGGDSDGGPSFVQGSRAVGPLFIGLMAAWWWLWGGHRNALVLLPAEANLLLTAPISRREIVRFKIMQAQIPTLVSALIATFFLRGSGVPWPVRFLSVWVMLSTLFLHQIGASLVHAAAAEHGTRGFRRNIIPTALFAAALGVLLYALINAIGDIRAAASLEYAGDRLAALMNEPGPRIALAPFRLVIAPTVAASLTEWAPQFLIALLVLAAHYVWVQRTDAAFEEAAIEEGAKRAERIHALQTGGLSRLRFTRVDRPKKLAKPWLPLSTQGINAYAIYWKNLLYVQRAVRPLTLAFMLGSIVVMVLLIGSEARDPGDALAVGGIVCLSFGGLVTVGGPLAFRSDLRTDLRYVDLLRTYPVRGRDMVIAQILGPTTVVTIVQLVLILPGLILMTAAGMINPGFALMCALAAVIALPIINAFAVSIQNAIALFYPGWVRIGETASGGMEAIGQNVLTLLFTLILLVIGVIPPLIVAAVVAGPVALLSGSAAVLLGAAALVAALGGEVLLIALALGRMYDRTDPVEAGLLR
jgi:ABC-2 type transport system permease protein